MKRSLLLLMALLGCSPPALKVVASKTTLLANGYDAVVLRIYGSADKPRLDILGDRRFCRLLPPRLVEAHWEAKLETGVMPGEIRLRVTSDGKQIEQTLILRPQITDSESDGTPDFLRLEEESDRETFRRWLTYLAEIQYFIPADKRNSEISDCSALVRFAYREALREHNAAWLETAGLPAFLAPSSIRKYSFPHTLLGARVFRTRGGAYAPADLTNGSFAEFADAKTIERFNTFFVSRDLMHAAPGDILFYRRPTVKGISYHSMIFVGRSQIRPDEQAYVVYHTGPDGANGGEIRRLTVTQLLHFPNPQWQPIAANPLFLGVYRWNIMKAVS